jgi:hypothetical protein
VAIIQAGRLAACGRPAELLAAASSQPRATLDDAIVALTGGTGELS